MNPNIISNPSQLPKDFLIILKNSIQVKPTGKFFVLPEGTYAFSQDSNELMDIYNSVQRAKQPAQANTSGLIFPMLYVGNPGTGKTYTARELAVATGRKFLRIGFKYGINFESILREYDKDLGWKMTEFYNLLVSQEHAVVLLDEFNIHGVDQKSFQILLDDQAQIEVFGQTITKNPNIQYILAINPQDTQTDPISFAIEDRCVEVYFSLTDKAMQGITAIPQNRFDVIKWVYQKFEIPYSIRTLQKCNMLSLEEFKSHVAALLKRRADEKHDPKVLEAPEFMAKTKGW